MIAEPLTPELQNKISKLEQECDRLHVPKPPKVFLEIEKTNYKTKDVIYKERFKANSWTIPIYKILLGLLFPMKTEYTPNTTYTFNNATVKSNSENVKYNFNAVKNTFYDYGAFVENSNIGFAGNYPTAFSQVDRGIVISENLDDENIEYNVIDRIDNTTNIIINYFPDEATETDNKLIKKLKKQFLNRTEGISFNINSIGILSPEFYYNVGGSSNTGTVNQSSAIGNWLLIERTKLPSTIVFDFPSALTITYEISMSLPNF